MNKQDIWQWLGPLAQSWGAEDALRAQSAVLLWPATGLTALARPLYVDRGVLHLAVASHVVAAELNFLKGKLLARLEEVAPQCGVVDLRFQIRSGETSFHPIVVPPPTAADLREARRGLPPRLPPELQRVLAEAVAWATARDRAILAAGGWRCPGCGLVLVKEKDDCPVCGIERFAARR